MKKIKNIGWEKFYAPSVCQGKYYPEKSFYDFLKFLKDKGMEQASILDIGCGYGAESLCLAKEGFEKINAVDINEDAIGFADLIAKTKNLGVNFIQADALKYLRELINEGQKIIISSSFAHAIKSKQRRQYFSEQKRILKKGGYLYLTAFAEDDPICQMHCPRKRWMYRKHIIGKNFVYFYCHFFTRQEIRTSLKGFKIIKFRKVHVPYPESALKKQVIKKPVDTRIFYSIVAQKI